MARALVAVRMLHKFLTEEGKLKEELTLAALQQALRRRAKRG